MPALVGVIERLHLYFFDSLVRGVTNATGIALNASALTASTQLFNHGNNQPAWTNFQGNGQFPGDRTYQIKALRVGLFFRQTAATAGAAVAVHRLYMQSEMQLYWKIWVGDKFMFVSQTNYLPMGAGIWGDIGSDTTLVVMNNGLATEDALLRLGRSIPIPPRQPFYVEANVYEIGTGESSLLTNLNANTGIESHIFFAIDGIATREAQ
jgi:hypothetical protein